MRQNSEVVKELLEVINFYQGIILDSIEQEIGDTQEWKTIRGRVLKALGDRGLKNRVQEIMALP